LCGQVANGRSSRQSGVYKLVKRERILEAMLNIEAEKIEIKKTLKRVEAAENRHDVEAMLEEMTDDAILHLCGMPQLQGRAATRELYAGFFETFVSTDITNLQVQVSSSGDMAWEYGTYVNVYKGPDGPIREEGKYLGVYRKVDGKWKGTAFCITPNG
jgi:uncharacterized protein (TIGR02246 family)